MQNNSKYSYQLDHVRALGVFLVFIWHFLHYNNFHQNLNSFFFLISFLRQGHIGVSLFMTLSGYLFIKILYNKKINWFYFYINRILRLVPLLIIFLLVNLKLNNNLNLNNFLNILFFDFFDNYPYGAWSVSVEIKFYLLLPIILFLFKKRFSIKSFIFLSILFNFFLYMKYEAIRDKIYYSFYGHLNEFLFGMLSFHYKKYLKKIKKEFLILVILLMLLILNFFDSFGGFYKINSEIIWVIFPSIQGFFYAILISVYDNNNFNFIKNNFSVFVSKIGLFSYSIYLWHFLFVFKIPLIINNNIINLDNIYLLLFFSLPCFLLMCVFGSISYYLIERPWLNIRKKYVLKI